MSGKEQKPADSAANQNVSNINDTKQPQPGKDKFRGKEPVSNIDKPKESKEDAAAREKGKRSKRATEEGEDVSRHAVFPCATSYWGWLGSRVVSVLDSGAEGPGFKSQSRRCRVTVLVNLFTPIVPLFTKQRNW